MTGKVGKGSRQNSIVPSEYGWALEALLGLPQGSLAMSQVGCFDGERQRFSLLEPACVRHPRGFSGQETCAALELIQTSRSRLFIKNLALRYCQKQFYAT